MKTMKSRSLLFSIIAVLILGLSLVAAGCPSSTSTDGTGAATDEPTDVHGEEGTTEDTEIDNHGLLTEGQVEQIKAAGVEALQVLQDARGDASKLTDGFMDQALETMEKSFADDQAAGKIRVRDYSEVEFSVSTSIAGLVGTTAEFIDHGHFVDVVTDEMIGQPSNQKYRFIFAMKQQDGVWKIAQILDSSTDRSDEEGDQDGTINDDTLRD